MIDRVKDIKTLLAESSREPHMGQSLKVQCGSLLNLWKDPSLFIISSPQTKVLSIYGRQVISYGTGMQTAITLLYVWCLGALRMPEIFDGGYLPFLLSDRLLGHFQ